MDVANWARRVESGGAWGYFDPYKTGTIDLPPVGAVEARYVSGLHNSWVVKKSGNSFASFDFVFGQVSSDPNILPIPKLFDINVIFHKSYEPYGIPVASITLTSEALSISIGNRSETYLNGDLSRLVVDLVDNDVDPIIADEFASLIQEAMDLSGSVEDGVLELYNGLFIADLSDMSHSVVVDVSSNMATSSGNGTPVNIGDMLNVLATNYDGTVQFPGVHCLPKRALLAASLGRGEAGCAGKSVLRVRTKSRRATG